MIGRIISFCNRKGGVGKTTCTISFADTLQSQFGKSVVVVDTDPQASSSLILARETMLGGRLNDKLLEHALATRTLVGRNVDVTSVVHHAAGRLNDRPGVPLDLIPISPRFWRFEVEVRREVRFYAVTQHRALRRFRRLLCELKSRYDFVLIDTAPGASMLFDHIIRASDFLVVPCVPDTVSVWGLDLLKDDLAHACGRRHPMPLAQVLWTQFNPNSGWQEHVLNELRVPFPDFRREAAGPGEAPELMGIGSYTAFAGIADPTPRPWKDLYPGQLGANLLRICESLLRRLHGDQP